MLMRPSGGAATSVAARGRTSTVTLDLTAKSLATSVSTCRPMGSEIWGEAWPWASSRPRRGVELREVVLRGRGRRRLPPLHLARGRAQRAADLERVRVALVHLPQPAHALLDASLPQEMAREGDRVPRLGRRVRGERTQ